MVQTTRPSAGLWEATRGEWVGSNSCARAHLSQREQRPDGPESVDRARAPVRAMGLAIRMDNISDTYVLFYVGKYRHPRSPMGRPRLGTTADLRPDGGGPPNHSRWTSA
jgi:hypothetical protein